MQNDMEDIELARRLLEEEGLTLVIIKKGQVLFESRENGIYPFFQVVLSSGRALHGAAIADRIVGSAVAMLCLHARIASVYAVIASEAALTIFSGKGVVITSENVVPHISNYDGSDLCPFEKMAQGCKNPSQLLSAMKSFFTGSEQ